VGDSGRRAGAKAMPNRPSWQTMCGDVSRPEDHEGGGDRSAWHKGGRWELRRSRSQPARTLDPTRPDATGRERARGDGVAKKWTGHGAASSPSGGARAKRPRRAEGVVVTRRGPKCISERGREREPEHADAYAGAQTGRDERPRGNGRLPSKAGAAGSRARAEAAQPRSVPRGRVRRPALSGKTLRARTGAGQEALLGRPS